MNIYEDINYPPPPREKFNLPLAFGLDKCNNGCTRFLVARVSVVGFLSGGRTIGTVSEGF